LAQTQAAFLLVGMRQRTLAIPQALCDRLAAAGDPLEVKTILDEAMRGLLTEMQDLPNRIDAAEWERFSRRWRALGIGGKAREGPNAPPPEA
jgi:hypothetical protein